MKDLPAGLNLYIFVSTLYGIVQQLIVYKTVD
jgi:YidC/Oxa1 family membrane protein insertase